ncbi:hypothetical protein [Nostoc sp. UHCC 0302]
MCDSRRLKLRLLLPRVKCAQGCREVPQTTTMMAIAIAAVF